MKVDSRQKILEVSKKEFLNKGFDGASLRQIARKSGLTTGAIYGYFKSKDDIFTSLVKDVADGFLDLQEKSHMKYTNFQTDSRSQDLENSSYLEDIIVLIAYIYEHFDVFKLLICYSNNTSYQSYFSQLVARHIAATEKMVEKLGLYKGMMDLDKEFVEIITNSYLSDIFEIVRRNMERKEAIDYVRQLSSFYGAGWLAIARADFPKA